MPVYTSNFASLLEPGLREIYGIEYNLYPEEYSSIFSVESSSKAFEEDHEIFGLGMVPQKNEGAAIVYDTAGSGGIKRYTHTTYGLGFMVTREAYEDDLYRKIKLLPKALARSVRHTIEAMGASVLNNAFTDASGIDGRALCASNHVLLGGGTYSNIPATAADLDITSFEQALIDIQNFVDNRGLKIAVRPKTLIISPENEFTAQFILKSDKLPDTANNNYNPAKGMLPYKVMHWLTDPDAWFILTDVPNGLNWFWRRRPEFTNDSDFDSENAKFKTTFRCSYGWTDPRCIYGTAGA